MAQSLEPSHRDGSYEMVLMSGQGIIYVFIEKLKKMSHDYPQNTHLRWAADLETELNATNELFLLTYSKCEHTCTH